MEIKLSEPEIQFLLDTNSDVGIQFQFDGSNQFTVIHPKATISCEIAGFTDRSVLIDYKLGFWKNLIVNWFFTIEKEGIVWKKKEQQIEVYPFEFLPQKEQMLSKDFRILGIMLDQFFLEIRLAIMADHQT